MNNKVLGALKRILKEIKDSCCGFYEIEDIREHLPKEWEKENLEEYLI